MPYKYLVESVCDRIAACKTYEKEKYTSKSALNYFLSKNDKNLMNSSTSKEMEKILIRIAEVGEKQALHELKTNIKNGLQY